MSQNLSSAALRVTDYSLKNYPGNNSLHAGNFFMILSSADFLQTYFSQKPSECQTVWIQMKPNILLGLIWVQKACNGFQKTTKYVA